jgi:hypothetical protein
MTIDCCFDMPGGSLISDTWVQVSIEDINRQVDEDIKGGEYDNYALHDREVPLPYGSYCQVSDAGP